ncbi:hypothetical protein [Xanthomonas translucens]|uniref:hypothetical protein n=2 Tax=Xanthomonas campestris pv. translucens TaxID=343 RepID=UPI0012D9ACB1|nr:hypothetical protein [Xanthomonas translucens]UJB14948.1 hypothetical protein LTC53_18795 [Xanthomonas translucens pv. undulosa]
MNAYLSAKSKGEVDMARNKIVLHYDGPIALDHKVTLRTLGSTLSHLQSAIDRAAIELRYGAVRKHARLKSEDYPLTDFIVGEPKEGGYILDLANSGPLKIVDRIHAAVDRAFREASKESLSFTESLAKQAERRETAITQGAQKAAEIDPVLLFVDKAAKALQYADRAINREVDQMLAQIRLERYEGSILDLQFAGSSTSPVYRFDKDKASRFHHVVAERSLGDPLLLQVRFRALDRGTKVRRPVGKAVHAETGHTFTIHFRSPESFNSVTKYMRAGDPPLVSIIACPVLEYGTFDAEAGDMFFLGLAE